MPKALILQCFIKLPFSAIAPTSKNRASDLETWGRHNFNLSDIVLLLQILKMVKILKLSTKRLVF